MTRRGYSVRDELIRADFWSFFFNLAGVYCSLWAHLRPSPRSVLQAQSSGSILSVKDYDMRWFYLLVLLTVCTCASTFAQKNPVPHINQPLVPDTVAPDGPAFTLTVNGSGFVSGAVVRWNGRARTTKFISGWQLKAAVSASEIAEAQTATITVQNPGSEPSNPQLFPVADSVSTFKMTGNQFATGGVNYEGLVTGDFNGDGNIDVAAVAGYGVSVLIGNGDGTFQNYVQYSLPAYAQALACADFNRDGKLDLAVTYGGMVSILLGKGDGSFQAASSFLVGENPAAIVAADFNGDGNIDLAVATLTSASETAQLVVRFGDGRGGFGTPEVTQLGAFAGTVRKLVAGDFNRDGKLDLATSGLSFDYAVLLGNGDGTFQVTTNYFGSCMDGIATADFNGDGILDLAIGEGCDGPPGKIYVMLGNGDGTFYESNTFKTNGQSPGDVVAADFNNDGIVDLAVADYNAPPGILLGNGDGSFQNVIKFPKGAGGGFNLLTVADVNNDGELDVIQSANAFSAAEVGVMMQQR
jgi:hypothetical protein